MDETQSRAEQVAAEGAEALERDIAGDDVVETGKALDKAEEAEKAATSEAAKDFFERGNVPADEAEDIAKAA